MNVSNELIIWRLDLYLKIFGKINKEVPPNNYLSEEILS